MAQTVVEDGGHAARKKPPSYRRPGLFLIFLCTFVILFSLNTMETTSNWKDQLWSRYFNATSGAKLSNRSADSPLNRFFGAFIERRTVTETPLTTQTDVPPTTQAKVPPTTQAKVPPTTQAKVPPTAQAKVPPTTQAKQFSIPPPPEYKSPGPYVVEYPYKYNFIINEEKRCQELKPFLVLIVPVAPQNKADRQIIRETWGAQKVVLNQQVALFFLLGLGKGDEKALLEESKEHRDMIQADFIDCYKNLTIKSMMMLEWLDSHCREAAYAMKIDSDMFLNLPKLVEMLQSTPRTSYLTGLVERAAVVHRHTSSKWFIPFDIFSGHTYPPYALGLGYVLSLDLAKRLVEVSREVKAVYIEDVYLGMCMHRLGLQPTDPPLHGAFHVFPLRYDRCQYSKIIATTLPEHMDRLWLWKDFSKPGPYC